MKIYSIQIPSVYKTERNHPPLVSFCSFMVPQSNQYDAFERKIITVRNSDGEEIQGTLEKNIHLKDAQGEYVKACIINDSDDKDTYYACVNNDALCKMTIYDCEKNALYIPRLKGQKNDGIYKGAGTELLKLAVEKSKELGYKGRLELVMTGSFIFYYKNNFRLKKIPGVNDGKDAYLDYAFRNNVDTTKYPQFDEKHFFPCMELDEKGAEALLNGARFCDESSSLTLFSKERKFENSSFKIPFDVDLSEYEQGKYAIQIIEKMPELKQKAYALLDFKPDEEGKMKPNLDDIVVQSKHQETKEFYEKEILQAFDIVQSEIFLDKISKFQ